MKVSPAHLFALHYPELGKLSTTWSDGIAYTIEDRALASRVGKVLRLRVGDEFLLFDEQQNVRVSLAEVERSEVAIKVLEMAANAPVLPQVTLAVGLLKKNALEQVAYYAAQLGIKRLVPLLTEKVSRSWGGDKELKRLKAVMIGAREQSKSFCEPEIAGPCLLTDFVASCDSQVKVYFEAGATSLSMLAQLLSSKTPRSITLILGSEAGLTAAELSMLDVKGVQGYTLTPTVLRAVEAVLVSAGAVLSLCGHQPKK